MESQVKINYPVKSSDKEFGDELNSGSHPQSEIFSNLQYSGGDNVLSSSISGQRRSTPRSFFQPSAKRLRFEEKPSDTAQLKSSILEWKNWKLEEVINSYNEHIMELYLHENDINLLDKQNVIKNPSTQLVSFVQNNKLKGDRSLEETIFSVTPLGNVKIKDEPDSLSSLTKTSGIGGTKYKKFGHSHVKHKSVNSDGTTGAHQDQMVEKARHEAYVIQRITALRKEGLWGEKKLPKVQEPARPKAHWDYLIEEMVWLSADFAQERKWKKAAAKKCAKMVQKYFQDKQVQASKAQKEQELKLRKIASFIAKEVRTFWNNIGKLVEFKVNARLDEKKKKALDQQLSFIVDQTEKYSSMLAESMKKNEVSNNPSRSETPSTDRHISDDEFQPDEPSSDDEDTIAKEDDNPEEQASEVQLLQKESEKPLDDLLSELPPEYFQTNVDDDSLQENYDDSNVDSQVTSQPQTPIVDEEVKDGDEDFEAVESDRDDEMTIEEQEGKEEGEVDHEQEIKELEAENEMSIEEIKKKYEDLATKCDKSFEEMDVEEEIEDGKSDDVSMNSLSSDDEDEMVEEDLDSGEDEETLGLEDLMDESFGSQEEDSGTTMTKERSEEVDKELEDASAAAEALQPKGFTLSSTSVTTPVPFLLKHTLREYQHVGLDWLVTMYEKKLNGILADEMGLGKTIQTIALLAHLACEKEMWGPHLIVVPTSVMLNWEMELKKWCPAFKILTYYGTQKERKMKRQGWTKSNAFHICITSYKLVIQDHQSFRRKRWCYFILDEAQNIKNFKSQRWQLLLNFQSHRRLLLTGTPLQNNLMELWSLMHFLMPNIFASHREFREWFSNPVTGMIEGNKEYNDNIIKRLHKVLRPFILRRLKSEVEQQMPKKFEHVVMCRLSKRQRFLYEEFMSRTKTKETLASGNFLSVINILMQLRKVCNHPNLFEERPTVSPFIMTGLSTLIPSIVHNINMFDPFKNIDLFCLNILLIELEICLTAFAAHRIRRFQAPQKLICEIDSASDPPPRCPAGKIKLHVRPSSQPLPRSGLTTGKSSSPSIVTLKPVSSASTPSTASSSLPSAQSSSQLQTGIRFQLVQQGGSYKAIPLPPGSTGGMLMQQTPQGPRLIMPQRSLQTTTSASTSGIASSSLPTTSASSVGVSGLQLVQTSAGQYLLTSSLQKNSANSGSSIGLSGSTAVALLQRLQGLKGLQGSVITTGAGGRPVLRLPTSSLRSNLQNTAVASTAVSTACVGSIPTAVSSTTASPNSKLASLTTGLQQFVASSKSPSLTNTQSNMSATSSPVTSPAKNIQSRPQSIEAKESNQESFKKKEDVQNKSIFHLNDLADDRKLKRREKLIFTSSLNTRKCHACPIYGSDLIEAVSVALGSIKSASLNRAPFAGQGMVHCANAPHKSISQYWYQTEALSSIVNTPEACFDQLRDVIDRFVFCVPSVIAPLPSLRVFHPHPSIYAENQGREILLKKGLYEPMKTLHPIVNASVTQFPDPRLIQYDCGKLQTLDKLLRTLKSGGHRVLIFTQMTRMLDVFESFLNFHGHLYLRLDGATKVEHRQTLMERFNQDKRIFVFILSTRSGGIGVNLTGADTVIFYDSDWNPTMDAQAQDRCHRIGQTRDVHIYRLISEKTIEENILKKANQKRLLGDLAIEGGNFTTASLKTSTIHDLFKVDVNEHDPNKRMTEVLEIEKSVESEKDISKVGDLENALAAAEDDERDVEATKVAKAEAAAELAEFDENIPLEEVEREEPSKAEQEVALLMKQLTPIEKYAMQFVEECDEGLHAEVERLAAEIEEQKKEWEMGRLQAIQDEQKRMKEIAEDDDPITYSATNAHNQMWVSYFNDMEIMPIWRPPTPPRDDNDLYVDPSLDYWYDTSSIMTEGQLPPVYIKKESNKRMKLDTPVAINLNSASLESVVGIRGNLKLKREEPSFAPRSLFERRDLKREVKLFKYRSFTRPSLSGLKTQQLIGKPLGDSDPLADWLVHEDWTIVQTIQQILHLPLNLSIVSLAHTPNWDLVCDLVNSFSVSFRSQRQCRARYENVLAVREENKETASPDPLQKKITKKQHKFLGAQGNSRGIGTFQLFQQDNNSKFSSLCSTRFETIKSITVKKTPTMKPMHVNPTSKNSKHALVLSEHGIQYEEPLLPSQVASNRAERIQREKQKTQAEMNQQQQQTRIQSQNQITVSQLQRQLQQAQHAQQAQQQIALVAAAGSNALQQSQQQQPVVVSASGLPAKVASSVVLNQGVAGNLVSALTVSGSSITSSAIGSTTTSTVASTALLSGVRATVAAAQGAGSTGRTTLTLQDLQARSSSTGQPTVVSVAGLSQLQAAKLTALTSQGTQQRVTGVPVQTRTLIPQQMQYLRQAQRQTLALHSGKVIATPTTGGDQQTIKRVQIAGQSGTSQKLQVAMSGTAVPGITAIQMVKPGTMVATASTSSGNAGTTGKTVTRTVTESEMNALLRRQPPQIAKVGQIAQMLAKQRSLVGMKGTTVGLQLGGKAGLSGTGLGTVQILQGGTQKHMTVQQIQQVFKQVQQQQQQSQLMQQGTIAGTVVGKAVAGTSGSNIGTIAAQAGLTGQTAKLIPVTVNTQQPSIKQTIQVVSASSTSGVTAAAGVASGLRVTSGERGTSTGVSLQGSTVRMTSPTLLSLGTATVHGQPVSVAVRNSSTPSPAAVRIQTSTSLSLGGSQSASNPNISSTASLSPTSEENLAPTNSEST